MIGLEPSHCQGHVIVSASFERDGVQCQGHRHPHPARGPVHGRSGRARSKPSLASSPSPGEGLNIGEVGAQQVADDYPGRSPWPFTGGTIQRAVVDVTGQPFVDLAAEARMAILRD